MRRQLHRGVARAWEKLEPASLTGLEGSAHIEGWSSNRNGNWAPTDLGVNPGAGAV